MRSYHAQAIRHRTILEDPARIGCLCSAAALALLPEVPFAMMLLVILVTQLPAVVLAARGMSRSPSGLAADFATVGACILAGAVLLARLFEGDASVKPLAVLTAAVCFLPEIQICRRLLAFEPDRRGPSFLDPALIAAALAAIVVCAIDRGSLGFIAISVALFQGSGLLTLVDKHLLHGGRYRLTVLVASLALIPVRLVLGDGAAGWGGGAIGLAIVAPDVWRWMQAHFRVAPATYVVLPRRG